MILNCIERYDFEFYKNIFIIYPRLISNSNFVSSLHYLGTKISIASTNGSLHIINAINETNENEEIEKLKNQLLLQRKEIEELHQLQKDKEIEIKKIKTKNQVKEIKILDSSTIHQLETVDEVWLGQYGKVLKVAMKHTYALNVMNVKGFNQEKFRQLIKKK